MRIRSSYVLFATLLAVTLLAASAATASLGYKPLGMSSFGLNNQKGMTLSVFAAVDRESHDSGFGVSLSQRQNGLSDMTYVDLDSFRLYQFSKLTPKQVGGYSVNFGFTLAYADPKDPNPSPDTPSNFMSGISVVLAKSEMSSGLSLDLRGSSLSKDFDPIAWFSNPDVLWIGAGLSYSF